MKKIYQIPEITVTKFVAEQMIAVSQLGLNSDSANSLSSDEILVKGDRGSRESYNVWDDDWSK